MAEMPSLINLYGLGHEIVVEHNYLQFSILVIQLNNPNMYFHFHSWLSNLLSLLAVTQVTPETEGM